MLPYSTFDAAVPLLRASWGLTGTAAGIVFASQQAGYTLAVLVTSAYTDLVGVRRIYVGAALLAAAAAFLFPVLAHDVPTAAALRALTGVGLAGTYVPGMRAVLEGFSARRGAAMGVYVGGFTLGVAASLALSGLVLRTLGLPAAFAVSGLGPLLTAAIAYTILPRAVPLAAGDRRIRFGPVLRNWGAMRYIVAYMGHCWELFAMRAWLPAFLTASIAGRPLVEATSLGAAFSAVALLGGAISNAAGGWLSDRAGRTTTIAVAMAGSAACSLVIGWLRPFGPALLVPLAMLYALLVTAESSTLSTSVGEHALPGTLGATLAVQSFLGFAVTIVSPLLFGWVLDASDWGPAFAILGAGALLGLGAMLAGRPRGAADAA